MVVAMIMCSILVRGNELFSIFTSSLGLQMRFKTRCWIPSLNTQCLENSAESGGQWCNGVLLRKRSVLTLGSQVPSAPCARGMCGIQLEVKKIMWSDVTSARAASSGRRGCGRTRARTRWPPARGACWRARGRAARAPSASPAACGSTPAPTRGISPTRADILWVIFFVLKLN